MKFVLRAASTTGVPTEIWREFRLDFCIQGPRPSRLEALQKFFHALEDSPQAYRIQEACYWAVPVALMVALAAYLW